MDPSATPQSDSQFRLKAGPQRVGKLPVRVLEFLARDLPKDQLLASYYVRFKRDLCFMKTTTYPITQPTDFYREALDLHHERFRRIHRATKMFEGVEGAAPRIREIGTFEVTQQDGMPPVPTGMTLDYLIADLVGHIDLVDYVKAPSTITDKFKFFERYDKKRAYKVITGHFPRTKMTGIDKHIRERLWGFRKDAGTFPGLTPAEWFKFAQQITKALKRIHNHGLVHGNLTVGSIRLRLTSRWKFNAVLIDFEEPSAITSQKGGMPQKKVDESDDILGLGEILFYLACGEDWNKIRENELRTTPSLSTESLTKSRLQKVVSKYVCAPLYDANDIIVSPSAFREHIAYLGIAKIIDKCLREGPTAERDRYLCCEDIAEELAIFERTPSPSFLNKDDVLLSSESKKDAGEEIKQLRRALEEVERIGGRILNVACNYTKTDQSPDDQKSFFHAILRSRIEQLGLSFGALSRRHYEIHGDREELIDHLTRSLAGLRKHDIYLTLTRPSYWSQQNLGSHGRFLSMNQVVAVERGVHTIRLFMLRQDERNLPAVRDILKYHGRFHRYLEQCDAYETKLVDLKRLPRAVGDIGLVPDLPGDLMLRNVIRSAAQGQETSRPIYYTGISEVNEDESATLKVSDALTTSKHVALILSRDTQTCVSIAFHDHLKAREPLQEEYLGETGGVRRIHKVRFTLTPWEGPRWGVNNEFAHDFLRTMDFHLARAVDIQEFLDSGSTSAGSAVRRRKNEGVETFSGAKEVPF